MPEPTYDQLLRKSVSRGSRLKQALAKLAEAQTENATLKASVSTLTTERDALKARPGAKDEPPKADEKPKAKAKEREAMRLDGRDDEEPDPRSARERIDEDWKRMGRDDDDVSRL